MADHTTDQAGDQGGDQAGDQAGRGVGRPAIDAVHYYWRPGCPFCMILRRGLNRAGIETVDHDIWSDPEAAAVVRSHAGGDETVPTVVIGETGMVNPSAKQVAAHLAEVAPHLLPA